MAYNYSDVSVIIPNWNGKLLLEKHLAVVTKRVKDAEIIVVDDASTDDSVQYLKDNFPTIHLVKKKKNEGFSSAVNAGADSASRALLLLLNTDIEPEENFLDAVFPLFKDDSLNTVGLMDKSIEKEKIVLRGRGVAQFEHGYYVHERGEVNRTDTAWVSGGSGVFKKEIWTALRGMDSLFNPFYWEDIDLSYRALKSGYSILFEPKSVVLHKHEEGAIKTSFTKEHIRQIAFRNQLTFFWKNISDQQLLIHHSTALLKTFFLSLIRLDFPFVLGFFAALFRLPQILQERKKVSKLWKKSDRDVIELKVI